MSGAASNTTTPRPSPREGRAAARPEGPAPTTATRTGPLSSGGTPASAWNGRGSSQGASAGHTRNGGGRARPGGGLQVTVAALRSPQAAHDAGGGELMSSDGLHCARMAARNDSAAPPGEAEPAGPE